MDKEQQKQLIIDIMNDDAKDGLYEKQTVVESPTENDMQIEADWLHNKLWENVWNGFTDEEVDRAINFLNKIKTQ